MRRYLHDPLLDNTVSVLTPFVAFLLAEEINASGVLAVVVCGLAMSQLLPVIIAAQTRLRARAFWQVSTFLLNGSLFVLVGLQLRRAIANLVSSSLTEAVVAALLVSAAVIGTRLGWMYTVPYLIRLVDRRAAHQARTLSARHRFPVAWSGFRGGVSLAAALAVPVVTVDGTPLPGRDLIIVVTFGVIVVTLLLHGLTLPAVLRWSRLPEDHDEIAERRLADRAAVEAGLAALPDAAARIRAADHVADRIRDDLEQRLADLDDTPTAPDEEIELDDSVDVRSDREIYRRLRADVLPPERAAVVKLRDDHVIDDIVLRWIEARIDAEELRLAPPPEE